MKSEFSRKAHKVQYRGAHVFFMALNATFGSFYFGYNLSVISPLYSEIRDFIYPQISSTMLYLVSSLITIGAAFGALISSKLSTHLGRRKSLIITDLIGIIGMILELCPSQYCLLVGRIIVGIGLGLNGSITPIYLAEISPPAKRGLLGGLMQNGINVGIITVYLIAFGLDFGTKNTYWMFMFAFPMITCFLRSFFLFTVFRIDTPKAYIDKNEEELAERSLRNIYGTHYKGEYLAELVNETKTITGENAQAGVLDLFRFPILPRFLLGCYMAFELQATGITAVNLYSNEIFLSSNGNNQKLASIYSLIMGCLGLVGSLLSLIILSKLGRRTIQLFGLFFISLDVFIFALVATADSSASPFLKFPIMAFNFFFSLTIGPIFFIYIPEILPAYGFSVVVQVQWITAFLCGLFFPMLKDSIQIGPTFFIMAAIGILGWLINFTWMRESKGKTKAEISKAFYSRKNDMSEIIMEQANSPVVIEFKSGRKKTNLRKTEHLEQNRNDTVSTIDGIQVTGHAVGDGTSRIETIKSEYENEEESNEHAFK